MKVGEVGPRCDEVIPKIGRSTIRRSQDAVIDGDGRGLRTVQDPAGRVLAVKQRHEAARDLRRDSSRRASRIPARFLGHVFSVSGRGLDPLDIDHHSAAAGQRELAVFHAILVRSSTANHHFHLTREDAHVVLARGQLEFLDINAIPFDGNIQIGLGRRNQQFAPIGLNPNHQECHYDGRQAQYGRQNFCVLRKGRWTDLTTRPR